MNDAQLVLEARGGDDDAWAELFRRHAGCLHRLANLAHLTYGRDLDDAFSRACQGLMVAVERFDPSRATEFIQFLWPVVRHHAIRADYVSPFYLPERERVRRRRGPRAEHSLQRLRNWRRLSCRDTTLEVEEQEERSRLFDRIRGLPRLERMVVRARMRNRPLREIGERLGGRTKQAIQAAERRAIKTLNRQVAQ